MSQFILLPRRGIRASPGDPARSLFAQLPTERGRSAQLDVASGIKLGVIDSVARFGPRLVEMSDAGVSELRKVDELRIEPIVEYLPAVAIEPVLESRAPASDRAWSVKVVDTGGKDIRGLSVMASDVGSSWNDQVETDDLGMARFAPPESLLTVEHLLIQPTAGYWGAFRQNVSTRKKVVLQVEVIEDSSRDALTHYYPAPAWDAGTGIRVGIIDSGIDEHRDLEIEGGCNTVTEEADFDFSSATPLGHGTHVAGIVAGTSDRSPGRGIAPGASLRSYRVFPADGWYATNYAIMKAMIKAQEDRCDIVNLSLETSAAQDAVMSEAVEDAREHGMVVVAAAGNSGEKRVRQPASCHGALAVAALGREGTFPPGAYAGKYISPHRGRDPSEFVASFSNHGPEITFIAPGVGIISTLPGNSHGPQSGTSMAAPVVTGIAATLMSREPRILSMARDRSRVQAVEQRLARSAAPCGFGRQYEGLGRPTF